VSARRSLRVRLTASFLLLAGIVIGVAAAALVRLVEQTVLGTLDAAMVEEAETLATLTDLPADRLAEEVRDVGREKDLGAQKFVRVVRPDGTTLAAWQTLPPAVARRRPAPLLRSQTTTARQGSTRYRATWAPVESGGWVVIGVAATGPMRLVRQARWAIGLGAGGLLLVLVTAAWQLTGRATREIDRLADEVATIEAGSLARRLSPGHTTEVDTLVAVLNRVLARLERSVEQLRRFTADAAHELRTPLTALRVRLEVALRRRQAGEGHEVLVDALEQVERLSRLAEDLLTLARVEGDGLADEALAKVVDIDVVVQEVARSIEPMAEEQARPFRWTTAPALRVRGAEPLLKRVIVNLVDNAFRHTPATATVELCARAEADRIVVEVRDDGPGIAPDVRAHLFERFRYRDRGGTGLGLALVREIVERHGGSVRLEPPPDGGTLARVDLPPFDGASPRPG
jgi:signal transduction histidine kinase